jgi:hypothetical protein
MKEKALYVAVGVVIGLVFAQQLKALPLVGKIPQV